MSATSRALAVWRHYGYRNNPVRPTLHSLVRRQLLASQPNRVLELGAGTGALRKSVAPLHPFYILTDLVPRTGSGCAIACDATRVPFQNGAFDAVIALEVGEHVPDLNLMLKECHRVLRSGGSLILSMPFMYGIHDHQDFRRLTPAGLEQAVTKVGFTAPAVSSVGGTLTTVTTLLSFLLTSKVLKSGRGWSSTSRLAQAQTLIAAVITLPFVPLTWLCFYLDRLVDRDSVSPTGLLLVAKRP